MKHIISFVIIALTCISLTGCGKQQNNTPDSNAKYEIENAISDDTFKSIIEGDVVPVEFILGTGGEDGYLQYSTKDSEIINDYINAFRQVTISEVVTDKEKMLYFCDAIVDYTFVLEDGTRVTFVTDLSTYVTNEDAQYILDNVQTLKNLNRKMQQ